LPTKPTPDLVPSQQHGADTAVTFQPFRFRKTFFFVGALLIVIAVLFLSTSSDQPEIRQFGRTRAIQLDVQNGSGEAKLAKKLTEYLRAEGFDVVEIGNYQSPDISETIVIDRTGNMEAAKSVAASLGVPEGRVVQKVDRNLFLDVTIVIGRDFASLKAFQ